MKGFIRSAAAVAVISLFFLSCGYAENFKTVIEKAKAKYSEADKKITDMVLVQKSNIETPDGTIDSDVTFYKKGDKYRAETIMQMPGTVGNTAGIGGMETIILFDGNDAWMISPFLGKQKLPKQEGVQHQRDSNWWGMIPEDSKITGSDNIDGQDCYIVEVSDGSLFPFNKVWIDKKDLLMIKSERKAPTGTDISLRYSDYKEIESGLKIPYKTEVFGDGKLISTSVVKSVEVNKGVSDDLFDAAKVKTQEFNFEEMMRGMSNEEE